MRYSVRDFGFGLVAGFGLAVGVVGCGDVQDGDITTGIDCIDGCNDDKKPEDGRDGEQGERGPRGVAGGTGPTGRTGSVGPAGSDGIPGHDGAVGPAGPDGAPGRDGLDGATGAPGSDGYSTVAQLTPSVTCEHGGTTLIAALDVNRNNLFDGGDANPQVTDICNGAPGSAGQDPPPTPYTVTQMIDPCGDTLGVFDEVLLRLADGTILASFSDNSNGKNTRLAVLLPGAYMTTDGSNCAFTYDGVNVTWN